MSFVGNVRANRHRQSFERLARIYDTNRSPGEIRAMQLERFNGIWRESCVNAPHFARLKATRGLPERFNDWEEFEQAFPILDRSMLRRGGNEFRTSDRQPDYWRVTGGTTSEPLQIPAWRSEDRITELDTWYARSWFGVDASSRLFLLWGHSHLLGDGVKGWWNARKRRLLDACLGYKRHSAYDLSDESLRSAGEALLRFKPRYLLGYSVALHRLAHANRHLKDRFKGLALDVAIATGESFPGDDSGALIADVFGCPVVMEYGAVETGIVAHQRPDVGFQVFWHNNYVEGLPSKEIPGAYEILVTTLYPRLVPLIRYRIGDLVKLTPGQSPNTEFQLVIGRCNDCIALGDGGRVHSEAFSHVFRDIGQIHAFQVEQDASNAITVNYLAERPLSGEIVRALHSRLTKVDDRLRITRIQRVERLSETRAGKTKRILSATAAEDGT